jgi:hypothetical protein
MRRRCEQGTTAIRAPAAEALKLTLPVGPLPHWLKAKNSESAVARREVVEDRGRNSDERPAHHHHGARLAPLRLRRIKSSASSAAMRIEDRAWQ